MINVREEEEYGSSILARRSRSIECERLSLALLLVGIDDVSSASIFSIRFSRSALGENSFDAGRTIDDRSSIRGTIDNEVSLLDLCSSRLRSRGLSSITAVFLLRCARRFDGLRSQLISESNEEDDEYHQQRETYLMSKKICGRECSLTIFTRDLFNDRFSTDFSTTIDRISLPQRCRWLTSLVFPVDVYLCLDIPPRRRRRKWTKRSSRKWLTVWIAHWLRSICSSQYSQGILTTSFCRSRGFCRQFSLNERMNVDRWFARCLLDEFVDLSLDIVENRMDK